MDLVAQFKYPVWCLAHNYLGHPHRGTLEMALHTAVCESTRRKLPKM